MAEKRTYCNPLDLAYRYQHMKEGRRRPTGRGLTPRWYTLRIHTICLYPCRRASGTAGICWTGSFTRIRSC